MTVRLNFLRRSWTSNALGEFMAKFIFILDLFSLKIIHNVGGMASKGLRAISNQVTTNFEAGCKPSHTAETLIAYSLC